MDICRAPCSDDHDGPEWFRITCTAREARDRTANTAYRIRADEAQERGDGRVKKNKAQDQDMMIEMFKAGRSYEEIAEATGRSVHQIQVRISYYRNHGHPELPCRATTRKPKIAKDALGSTQEGKKVESPAESPNLLPQPQDAPTFKAFGLEIEPANQEAPIQPQKDAPAMVREILPSVPVDAATIHSLIDMALRLPNLKKDLLHYADEVEAAGKYAISLAGQIRGAVGA